MANKSPQVMTRADLFDWVVAHGCQIQTLDDDKAKVIKVKNPKNNAEAFIALPMDDKPVKDFTVCTVCVRLGIEVPTHAQHLRTIHDRLEREHGSDKRKF